MCPVQLKVGRISQFRKLDISTKRLSWLISMLSAWCYMSGTDVFHDRIIWDVCLNRRQWQSYATRSHKMSLKSIFQTRAPRRRKRLTHSQINGQFASFSCFISCLYVCRFVKGNICRQFCTLFCLVQIKKRLYFTSCVFWFVSYTPGHGVLKCLT